MAKITLEHLDSSIPNFNTKDLKQRIIEEYKTEEYLKSNKIYFIYGAVGVGKTSIVEQISNELDISFINLSTVILSEKYLEEILFYMSKETAKGIKSIFSLSFLPKSNNNKIDVKKGGILFFDDFNHLTNDVFIEFLKNRSFHKYLLPENWMIVAAGNRIEEAPVFNFIDNPVTNKIFTFVNYAPTVEEWVEWAEKYNNTPRTIKIDDSVIDFLKSASGEEWFFASDTESRGRFANPRDWAELGIGLTLEMRLAIEDGRTEINWEDIELSAELAVGRKAAQAFLEYTSVKRYITEQEILDILNPDKIVNFLKKVEYSNDIIFEEANSIDSLIEVQSNENNFPNVFTNFEPIDLLIQKVNEKVQGRKNLKLLLIYKFIRFIEVEKSSSQQIAMLCNAINYLMKYKDPLYVQAIISHFENYIKQLLIRNAQGEDVDFDKTIQFYAHFSNICVYKYLGKYVNNDYNSNDDNNDVIVKLKKCILFSFDFAFTEKLPNAIKEIVTNCGVILTKDKYYPNVYTNGENIWFSVEYVRNLTLPELRFVFIHEYLHVLQQHTNKIKYSDRFLWNVACDYAVNQIITTLSGYKESVIETSDDTSKVYFTFPKSDDNKINVFFDSKFNNQDADSIFRSLEKERVDAINEMKEKNIATGFDILVYNDKPTTLIQIK